MEKIMLKEYILTLIDQLSEKENTLTIDENIENIYNKYFDKFVINKNEYKELEKYFTPALFIYKENNNIFIIEKHLLNLCIIKYDLNTDNKYIRKKIVIVDEWNSQKKTITKLFETFFMMIQKGN